MGTFKCSYSISDATKATKFLLSFIRSLDRMLFDVKQVSLEAVGEPIHLGIVAEA